MSGRCVECDRLVTIEAKELRGTGRQRNYYPVPHPVLGDDTGGRACPGTKRPV